VRPVVDAPGTRVVPFEPFVEYFGMPSSGAELLASLHRAVCRVRQTV
jgi:hypothetical protein